MIKPLSREELQATHVGKMTDVTSTAEAVVDIWPYILKMVETNLIEQSIYGKGHVAYVYRNGDETFEHVLLPTKDKNTFVVIVIDLINKSIYGHFLLDLEVEYGLK